MHEDTGRHVYTFVRKATGVGIRVTVKPAYWEGRNVEHKALLAVMRSGTASEADRARWQTLQVQRGHELMAQAQAELLEIEAITLAWQPKRFGIPDYLPCAKCGALTLDRRLTLCDGQPLCERCLVAVST